MRRPKTKHPSLDNRLNAAPRPWIRNSQTPPKSELRYSKPSSGNSQTLPKSELRYRKKGLVCKIHAQGAPNGFEDRGPFSTFEPAKSKELERDGWMGYGVEALPSSTVGDSAAETRPTARIRNGRTTARFMPKGRLMGLRTGGLSAPSNQLKAKSWREMDGWMGYISFAVQHRRRCGCRNTSEGTVPHPSKIHAQAVPHGFEDRGPFSTFKPANSKELERDGWMGYRSFAVQHRRRFGCRNTSEGTVAKRQNPSKIRAQAQQKTVRSAGPKQHLWSPLRRRKEPQRVDHKHGAT